MAGLLDYLNRGLTGSTSSYGGLLTDEDQKAAQQQAQLAMAAQLLDAGGWSPNRTSFGQAIGRGMSAAGQARQGSVDQSLQAALLRKQLQSLNQKDAPKRYVVNGNLVDENGKPVFTAEDKPKPTEAESLYQGIERLKAGGATESDPRVLALQRQIEILGTRAPGVSVNVGDKLPNPPQGYAYQPDQTSPWGYRLAKLPGAPDNRSEGERKASLFADRMEQLGKDVIDSPPSAMSQKQFEVAQKGGFIGAGANKLLSPKEQKHFNAARGWLAGILRNDTGATITAEEFNQYYPTYFPVPGDSGEVIEQKRQLRTKTQQGVRANSGMNGETRGGSPPSSTGNDNVVNWDDL